MSVPAQAGAFGFGMQTAKTTDAVYSQTAVKTPQPLSSLALPYTVLAISQPAQASLIGFTVTTLLGSGGTGDVTIQLTGTLTTEYQAETIYLPAASAPGYRVFSRFQYDVVTSVIIVEQSTVGVMDVGAYTSATGDVVNWFQYKSTDINLGIVQDERSFPLEVGGDLVPTGEYKAGAFVGGGATVNPRLQADFGWMLKALMGQDVCTGPTNAAVFTHVFQFNTDQTSIPWCASRKLIPGPIKLGETGKDCKVSSIRFTIPPNGIIQARLDVIGITPLMEDTPSWTWAHLAEAYGSVPLSSKVGGFVKFPASGSALPIQSVVITMVNNLSSPQQEMIVGNPFPDDLVVLSRAMTIQAQLKWKDPVIYEQCVAAASGAGVLPWSDQPYTTTFQCKVLAPSSIILQSDGVTASSPDTKHSLQIDCALVSWQPNGSPILAGGDLVILPLVGTVLAPVSGTYATFTVLNGQVAY